MGVSQKNDQINWILGSSKPQQSKEQTDNRKDPIYKTEGQQRSASFLNTINL